MGDQGTTSRVQLVFCFAIHTAFFLGSVHTNDPFEGNIFSSKCMKGWPIKGCPNETLMSAYSKTEWAKDDQNFNKADTCLYLFTPCNRENPEFLHKCGGMLPENTNFRPDAPTIIIVGGYMSPICFIAMFREIKDQLLCSEEFRNVILVDWVWGNGPDYYGAVRNTMIVGKQLAFVIWNIMKQTGAPSENFYIVGHSLGAHIGGCAGEYLLKLGVLIRRITGLDPAGPAFMGNMTRCSLTKKAARLIDIIHSNAGHCLPFALGRPDVMGHADFFPNGGSIQLSCYVSMMQSFLKCDVYYAILLLSPGFCPHFQSLQYYKESINACGCQFVGVQCTHKEYKAGRCKSCGPNGIKCAVMGYDWERCQPKFESHSYYLSTKLVCPHCNNESIKLKGFSVTPPRCGERVDCYKPGKCPVHQCRIFS